MLRAQPRFGFAAVASGLSASMGARVALVKRATAAYMLNVKTSSVACCRPSIRLTDAERDLILAGLLELTITHADDDEKRERCKAVGARTRR
jgi:hypothetical protein